MDTADRIGLLSFFGWMAGHDLLTSILICLALTPVGVLLVGYVLESRFVPLSRHKQFLSFYPGDVFLGFSVGTLLFIARYLPDEVQWYNSELWHVVVFFAALGVATFMTLLEYKDKIYPPRAIASPTKLYHNYLLYGGYGYVAVTTLVAVIFGGVWKEQWVLFVLGLLPGLIWVWLVKKDNSLGKTGISHKAVYAHVPDWKPIWLR